MTIHTYIAQFEGGDDGRKYSGTIYLEKGANSVLRAEFARRLSDHERDFPTWGSNLPSISVDTEATLVEQMKLHARGLGLRWVAEEFTSFSPRNSVGPKFVERPEGELIEPSSGSGKIVWATEKGRELIDQEGDHGPPNEMEVYYDESDRNEITLSTEEREQFEVDSSETLEADVIPDLLMERILTWCEEENLKLNKLYSFNDAKDQSSCRK